MSKLPQILIIDDDKRFTGLLKEGLSDIGYSVTVVADQENGRRALERNQFLLLFISNVVFPDSSLIKYSKSVKKKYPWIEILVFSPKPDFREAFKCISSGIYEYLVKTNNIEEFVPVIDSACKKAENKLMKQCQKEKIDVPPEIEFVSKSSEISLILKILARVAPSDSSVLITGETGVGKELIARMIHKQSLRKDKPFVAINCASIPETLLENELFGHEKGSYTDALSMKKGLLEEADGGTLFLDEISELSVTSQVKLLRAIETCSFRRLGGEREIGADVRFISATNRDMKEILRNGHFKSDFYYRLAVILLHIPPLRERKEDIPLLIEHYLGKYNKMKKKLSPSAERLLLEYNWPGNVRELKNIIERLSLLSDDETIMLADVLFVAPDINDLRELAMEEKREELYTLDEFERKYIEHVLTVTNGHREKAAKILDISPRTIYNKLNY